MDNKLLAKWKEQQAQIEEEVIQIRRYLHQYPEPSFEEFETSQYIYDYCMKLPHVEVTRPTKTSVLVKIDTGRPGKKIGFRADIDALTVDEENDDIDYVSKKDGLMHACGHDGHTAMLLVASKFLANNIDLLFGEIYAIFQHAEETFPGGAGEMVATGLFNDFDFIYGQHIDAHHPFGENKINSGMTMGNSDRYMITINGKGGHASRPELSIDPVVIATDIILSFQTLLSRQKDTMIPAVISNTFIEAGAADALNVIPEIVKLGGSVRTNTDEARDFCENNIKHLATSIAEMYGATADVVFKRGYSSIPNNEKTTEFVRGIMEELYPGEAFQGDNHLGGEDFSAFARKSPATYIFLGAGIYDEHNRGHHSSRFNFDERVLFKGATMIVTIADQFSDAFQNIDTREGVTF